MSTLGGKKCKTTTICTRKPTKISPNVLENRPKITKNRLENDQKRNFNEHRPKKLLLARFFHRQERISPPKSDFLVSTVTVTVLNPAVRKTTMSHLPNNPLLANATATLKRR